MINCKRSELHMLISKIILSLLYSNWNDKSKLRDVIAVRLYICFIDKYSEKTSSHAAAGRLTRRTADQRTYLSRIDRKCWICSSSLVKRDKFSKKRSTYPINFVNKNFDRSFCVHFKYFHYLVLPQNYPINFYYR